MPEGIANNIIYLKQRIKQYGFFFTIRKSTVYFIYQSAKNFVLKNASEEIFPSEAAIVYCDVYIKSIQKVFSLKRNIYYLQNPSISRIVVEILKKDLFKPF